MNRNEHHDYSRDEPSTGSDTGELRVDVIDKCCDEFEDALLAGHNPVIEDYLEAAAPEMRRELFLELLLSEQEFFRNSGQLYQHSDYIERFPDYQREILQAFATAESDTLSAVEDTIRTKPVHVGSYRILERLGEGGMGTVYKAVDAAMHRTVAIKVLPRLLAQNDRVLARFQREMTTIARLDHPSVVRASHADCDADQHYIVMEYLDGLDLGRISRTFGYLEFPDACEIVRQAAMGVGHLHHHGVVHRDIKPSNIMLCQDCTNANSPGVAVKIIDFGLAWIEELSGDELTTSKDVFGTIQYMAPEQFVHSRSASETADIYSLGATLYRLLSGKSPYQSASQMTLGETMKAISGSEPVPITQYRSDVPKALAAILSSMLSHDPERRIQTATEVVNTLEQFTTSSDLNAVISEARKHQGTDQPLRTALVPNRKPKRGRHTLIAAALCVPLAIAASILLTAEHAAVDGMNRTANTATTEETLEQNKIQLSQYAGLSSFEAIHWKDKLYLFYSDEDLFGIEGVVDDQLRLVSVRQSHFTGHRSFCGRDPKKNPPLFPIVHQTSGDQQELYAFLPTGSQDNRMQLKSLFYYRVQDQGVSELKQPWEAENVFDYYSPDASGAPPMKPLCGSDTAIRFPPDVNSCCVVGDDVGILIICTQVSPRIHIYRIPWDHLDSTVDSPPSLIEIAGKTQVRYSDTIIYNDQSTGQARLMWFGNTEKNAEGKCRTLVMEVSTELFNERSQVTTHSVQWTQLDDLPSGEVKLVAPDGQNVQALILNRSRSSPTVHTIERNINGSWRQLSTTKVADGTPQFAAACTGLEGAAPSLLVASPEQPVYHSIRVLPTSEISNEDKPSAVVKASQL